MTDVNLLDVGTSAGLNLYLDYDEWQRKDPRVAAGYTSYDRSLLLVADYYY